MVENTQNQNKQNDMDMSKIPSKFKDAKTGEINVQALLKSYLELEKKLSNRSKLLPAATVGTMPNSPDDYKIVMKNPKLVMDEDMNKQLFELGFTNEQLQAIYDLAADKIIPLLENLSADYRADKEMAELENEFGGAEAFNTIARQISAWGEKNLNPEIFNTVFDIFARLNKGAEKLKVNEIRRAIYRSFVTLWISEYVEEKLQNNIKEYKSVFSANSIKHYEDYGRFYRSIAFYISVYFFYYLNDCNLTIYQHFTDCLLIICIYITFPIDLSKSKIIILAQLPFKTFGSIPNKAITFDI